MTRFKDERAEVVEQRLSAFISQLGVGFTYKLPNVVQAPTKRDVQSFCDAMGVAPKNTLVILSLIHI